MPRKYYEDNDLEERPWVINAVIVALQILNLITVVTILGMMGDRPRTYSTAVPESIQEVRKEIRDADAVSSCADCDSGFKAANEAGASVSPHSKSPRPATGTGCEMRVERPLTWL